MVAPTDAHVLIVGETGTGKELIALSIQKQSRRNDKVFISLNCAALPADLIETKLFGYLKGAFTGADADRVGIIAAADGGTLFLDEINSLDISAQIKLLRFIENGEYLPVGAIKTQHANVRIIAATNTDLENQISIGRFRQDLYFRLNVMQLKLPALRDRKADIQLLLKYYFSYFAKKHQVRTPSVNQEVLAVLQQYAWPGNIRELCNLCENLSIQRLRRPITLTDLPKIYTENQSYPLGFSQYFELPPAGIDWGELEASLIQQAMEKSSGKYKEASQLLGISRDALYYRIKKYNLEFTDKKA